MATSQPITDSLKLIYPPQQKLPEDSRENPKSPTYRLSPRTLPSFSLGLSLYCTLLSGSITGIHTGFDLGLRFLETEHFSYFATHLQHLDLLYWRFSGLACPSGLIIVLIRTSGINYWPLLSSTSFFPKSRREKMLSVSVALFPPFLSICFP